MSSEITEADFREIGPFEGDEVRKALKRVFNHPTIGELAKFLFPTWSFERFKEKYDAIRTVEDFQDILIAAAIKSLTAQTTAGVSIEGTEDLDPARRYLFISNHRDIVLDPALLTYHLHLRGHRPPKLALGDNLLVNPLVTDLVRLNKSIIVRRGVEGRELFKATHVLTAYIHRQISEGIDSVWIAQREGRAKDGRDRTQPAVIKMLGLSREMGFLDRLRSLRIVPVAISYELDPCDIAKAIEVQRTAAEGSYVKAPLEDLMSMIEGIRGWKGRVAIRVGPELGPELDRIEREGHPRGHLAGAVAEALDHAIVRLYRLWPSNFIACDLAEGSPSRSARYSTAERDAFVSRLEDRLKKVDASARAGVRSAFLAAYANPVLARENLDLEQK